MATPTPAIICAILALFLLSIRNLHRVFQTWKFLLNGRTIMLDRIKKNPQTPFSLPIPGNRLHVVSSPAHWNDINSASTSQLSPNAASREMFQPKYTFGFDWAAPREHVSLATVRSIRNMTSQLPEFQARFVGILDEEFGRAMSVAPQEDGWTRVPLWKTVQRAVTRINTLLLLGESVAYDEEFTERGINYVDQTTMIFEAVRLVPSFLAPVVTKLIKGRGREQAFVLERLRQLIAEREAHKRDNMESIQAKPGTYLEGVIDYCQDDRSTQQNADSINSTWVISTLAIPVVTCQLLQDLYTRPDHFKALQEEAQSVPLSSTPAHPTDISSALANLPHLEAFAMESWRTNCFQANTAHRIAMKPFTFSDGYKVPAGEAVEFNQHALMTNDSRYPDHSKFDPTRFMHKDKTLVDTGIEWPFWGVARYICPGRWHVANVEKLVAVYMMQRFEAKPMSIQGLNFEWRDALVPNPKSMILLRRRLE